MILFLLYGLDLIKCYVFMVIFEGKYMSIELNLKVFIEDLWGIGRVKKNFE